jgi:hypothetical protein
MMNQFRLHGVFAAALAILFCAGFGLSAEGPSGKSKAKAKSGAVNLKSLDARVDKLEATMVREIMEVANLYEEAEQYERAKTLLEVLLKLNPDLPAIKEKVDTLEQKAFDKHEVEFTLDTSRGWTAVGGAVAQGRPVRIEVNGEYKFNVSASVTADGFPSSDPATDFIDGIPCGALMGMVANKTGRPGKPFPLKGKQTWTPQENGILYLKINAPAGHKCAGKLTVKLSGLVQPQ